MSFLNININDIQDDEKTGDYAPLPAGWYDVTLEKAELCDTRAGTGKYIKCMLRTDNNRVLFTNMNIQNPNSTAQNIGLQQLKIVAKAQGLETVQESDQLVGARFSVKVSVEEDTYRGDGSMKNEVKGFKAIGGAPAMPKATPKPAAPAPAPSNDIDEMDIPF